MMLLLRILAGTLYYLSIIGFIAGQLALGVLLLVKSQYLFIFNQKDPKLWLCTLSLAEYGLFIEYWNTFAVFLIDILLSGVSFDQ
jgi:hypothetical protein